MNCVAYSLVDHKKINGTLFYAFEYFVLLRDLGWNVKFLLLGTSAGDLDYIKSVFIDKYNFNIEYLKYIVNVQRYTDAHKLNIENVIMLDILTYNKYHMLLGAHNILAYSNDVHDHLNNRDNTIFYGWYEYQIYNKKNRLKVYADIHKKYADKGNKIFVSSPDIDYEVIIKELSLNPKNILVKDNNIAHSNLFKKVGLIIYYQSRKDTNNRLIIESHIHNIDFILYNSDHFPFDSLVDRKNIIDSGNIDQLLLDENDIMIQDFIRLINV